MERQTQLKIWLSEFSSLYGLKSDTLEHASADAGFRQYFRIEGASQSFIVMDCPKEKDSMKSFVKIRNLLASTGVNVPEIFKVDYERGFMLLSDLGTTTYLDVIDESNADILMNDATNALVTIQSKADASGLPKYDAALLRKELELFPEWFLEKHLKIQLSETERKLIDGVFDLIIAKNMDQPYVFVHRDYMPRNLMVEKENNPGILDFQDAVYGPISYDIASLCRDAFISWEEHRILDWTIRYWDKARKANLPVRSDFGQFWEDVEWMGLQRHLKVLGIFARLNYRDGKEKYLADTPRFIEYVSKTAKRYDALKPLSKIIDRIQNTEEQVGYTF